MVVLGSDIADVSPGRSRTALATADNGWIMFAGCDGRAIGNWHWLIVSGGVAAAASCSMFNRLVTDNRKAIQC